MRLLRHSLSFRVQLFLASLILVILPSALIGTFVVYKNSQELIHQYNASMSSLTTQTSSSLDTLLQDASKVADMPLLSDDMHRIMKTNYGTDYYSYARDSQIIRNLFRQTNRLNTNLQCCLFVNQYGYSFEYNIKDASHRNEIEQNLASLRTYAEQSSNHSYFVPPKGTDSSRQTLSMIRIIYDGYDYTEIGVCYLEINFDSVEKLLKQSLYADNALLIYNQGDLAYCTEQSLSDGSHSALAQALADFSSTLSDSREHVTQSSFLDDHVKYYVNGCVNNTTGWHIVQFLNNHVVTNEFHTSMKLYFAIILGCILTGILIAYILSSQLSRSVEILCEQMNSIASDHVASIDENICGSGREFHLLIRGLNQMNSRLIASLKQAYESRLIAQKTRIKMLQFQIDHHFLYNTLNSIKALADIHNVPEIAVMSQNMSDMLRYNLEKFPDATLYEELLQVRRYLEIQDVRFPGKFSIDINIPDSLLSLRVPVFILQPIVENCIQHGFPSREKNCYISIFCQQEEDVIHLFVADNGDGFEPDRLALLRQILSDSEASLPEKGGHRSLGIQNVSQRIREYYGNDFMITIESAPGQGTVVSIPIFRKRSTSTDPADRDAPTAPDPSRQTS